MGRRTDRRKFAAISSIVIALSSGCAALSGLSSLDEVPCANGECDGGTNPNGSDGMTGEQDSGSPLEDGESQDSSVGSTNDSGREGGGSGDAASTLRCGKASCNTTNPICCVQGVAQTTACEQSAPCIDAGEYALACTQTSDCLSGDACCLDTLKRVAGCVAADQCPLISGTTPIVRLCTLSGLADAICGAGFDCLPDKTLTNFNSCQ